MGKTDSCRFHQTWVLVMDARNMAARYVCIMAMLIMANSLLAWGTTAANVARAPDMLFMPLRARRQLHVVEAVLTVASVFITVGFFAASLRGDPWSDFGLMVIFLLASTAATLPQASSQTSSGVVAHVAKA